MNTVNIYDLSQRRQIEDEAKKRTQQRLSRELRDGSAYDLNHVKAVTEHFRKQQQKPRVQSGSIYNCSIKH